MEKKRRSAVVALLIAFGFLSLASGQVRRKNAPARKEPPKLLFKVTFDDLTANAEVAGGNPRSTLARELGLTARAGVKKTALLLGPGEECAYNVKGNLNLSAGTISCWVKPFNWNDTEGRFQKFFWVYGFEDGEPFGIYLDNPNSGGSARMVMSYRPSNKPGHRLYQINAKADWKSGKWVKIDFTWDESHVAIYTNGKLGERQDIGGIKFPKFYDKKFFLVPQYHSGDGRYHNRKDRSLIDEFEIWSGPLSADRILQRYLADIGGAAPPPMVRVPRVEAGLTLDGKLDESMWKKASRVPVGINIVTMFPHSSFAYASLCYDRNNLYVGFYSPKGKRPLASKAAERDGRVWLDDAFELFLIPDLSKKNDFCQFIFNAKGTMLDGRGGASKWNSRVKRKAYVGDDYWTVEVAVPFRELGASPPRPGDVWMGNFCRDWYRPLPANPVYTTWAYAGTSFLDNPERFGKLVFSGKENDGARVEIAPTLSVGTLNLSVSSGSAGKAAVLVTSGGETVFEKSSILRDETKVSSRLRNVKEGVLSISVKDAAGKDVLVYSTHFMITEPIDVAYIPDPVKKELGLEINLSNVEPAWLAPVIGGKAALEISFKGPRKDVGRQTFKLEGLKGAFTIPFAYEVGSYEITCRLAEPGHSEPLMMVKTLEVPPLPWAGTTVGETDKVLSPWTPLEYKDAATISCWGRTYTFDGPFLAGALNQGKEILSGPIQMTVRTPRGSADFGSTGGGFTRKDPTRAEFKGKGKFGGIPLTVEWSAWMEYDGLTVAALTINPAGASVNIAALSLRIPIRSDVVKYIRGEKHMGGLKTGRVKWDHKRWESSFQPFIWVCNEEEGFVYFCESEANWVYPEDARNIVAVQAGENAFIEVNLISKPTKLRKPVSYTFGFQATPVKPMMKERRAWNFGMATLAKRQNARNWMTGYAVQDGTWDVARPQVLRKFDRDLRARGIKLLYYGVTSCTPDRNPTYDLYRKLWASNYSASYAASKQVETKLRGPWVMYRLAPVCPGSYTFQDYMLYYADKMLRQVGVPGLYTDTDGLVCCDNKYHGGGFTDVFGKSGVTYTILRKRRFAKRMAAIMRSVGSERRWWQTHAHAKLVPPVHCWADFWLPGEENTHHLYGNKWFYIDTLEDVAWRVEYNGTSSGLVHTFLPEFYRGTKDKTDMDGPQPTESLIAMCAATDVNTTGGYLNVDAIGEFWDLRKRLEIINADFIGYWEDECPVKAVTEKALASVYKSEDIISIPVANRLPESADVTVEVDLKALGLNEGVGGVDERTGRPVALKGDSFTVSVKGRNYTFVSFRRR